LPLHPRSLFALPQFPEAKTSKIPEAHVPHLH
jgi:hypothetical protein